MPSKSRIDARLKVTGEARYTGDLQSTSGDRRPLHAVVVQSPVPSGKLLELKTEAALALGGLQLLQKKPAELPYARAVRTRA